MQTVPAMTRPGQGEGSPAGESGMADRVVALDAEMKPWAIGRPRKGARYVIDLPAGTIARTGTQVGDQLQVRYGRSKAEDRSQKPGDSIRTSEFPGPNGVAGAG